MWVATHPTTPAIDTVPQESVERLASALRTQVRQTPTLRWFVPVLVLVVARYGFRRESCAAIATRLCSCVRVRGMP